MRKLVAGGLGFRSFREGSSLRNGMGLVVSLGSLVLLAAMSGQTNAQTLATLLSFSGSNGAYPYGSLTLSGGTLYGMTRLGGTNGDGNIFSLNTDGSG